jgi:hypothetical protein
MYAWYAIFEWPRQIKDTEVLNRLYLMVFQKMQEILNDIEKFVPFGVTERTESRLPEYIEIFWRFRPGEDLKEHIQENHLDNEFDTLMDTIWKIGEKINPKEMPKKWKKTHNTIEQSHPE